MQKMHGILEIRTKKARDEIRAHTKNMLPIFRKNHLKTITSRSPDSGSSPSHLPGPISHAPGQWYFI